MRLHVMYRWRSIQALFTIKMPYGFKYNFSWARNKRTAFKVPIFTKRTNVQQHYVRTSCTDCHQIGQQMWPVRTEILLGPHMKYVFGWVVVHWLATSCKDLLYQISTK